MTRRRALQLLLAALPACEAPAVYVQGTFDYTSSVSSDDVGPLDLVAEVHFDDAVSGAPIAVVMHGYSPTNDSLLDVRANARRLRDDGFFAVSVAMRGRDGSDGARDSGGLEIYDIYDAVEAVKEAFSSLVDPTNVHIAGYSGGGGNAMSALTKFPDYFRASVAFFGMSDYGFDPDTGWYFNGAGDDHRAIMDADIGDPTAGDPSIRDRYHARASNLAARDNPYGEIHLFVNDDEPTCPPVNVTSYRDNALRAASFIGEFDNITLHIGTPASPAYQDFNRDGMNDADELQSWPHGFPSAAQQGAGELWYRDRLLDGSIPEPVLDPSDELFVAGFVKTKRFELWLGDGQNAAGLVRYRLSPSEKTFDLTVLSSDLDVGSVLWIETDDMAGRQIDVSINGGYVETITGGRTLRVTRLGHGDSLVLRARGSRTPRA